MSLLMDALKRAEQARQAEAARRAESGEGTVLDDAGLSLDPVDTASQPVVGEQTSDAGISSSLPYGDQTLEESLVRMDDESDLELEPAPEFDSPAPRPPIGGSSSDFDFSLLEDTSASLDVPDDPEATLPSVRAAQRSVDEYFSGTGSTSMSASMSASIDATGPTDTTATGASSIDALDGSDLRSQLHDDATTTQRQAQIVFEAGRTRPSALRPVALGIVVLGFIGALGFGVFTYWQTLERMFIGKPTVIAKRQRPDVSPVQQSAGAAEREAALAEAMRARLDTPGAVTANAGSAGAGAGAAVVGSQSTSPAGSGAQVGASAGAALTSGAGSNGAVANGNVSADDARQEATAQTLAGTVTPATPQAEIGASNAAPGSSVQTLPSREMLAALPGGTTRPSTADRARSGQSGGSGSRSSASAGSSARGAGSPKGISRGGFGSARPADLPNMSIRKRTGISRKQTLLDSGYRAIQSGDNTTALKNYKLVLASDRNDRDALLGLAAVYVHRGESGRALGLYSHLLKRNPRDSAAQAGVIALTDSVDPQAGESRIKALLHDEPSQPYLHFSLGNMYAAQGRWPEAQQAYFDAYRLEDKNPDYAFNLAVSLDRLQQRMTALEYYKTAMKLSTERYASFDAGGAAARIDRLEAGATR